MHKTHPSRKALATLFLSLAVAAPTHLFAQAQAPRSEAELQAARDAQGYMPFRLWERPDVRVTRVEIKPMANRATHQHDDVKFHIFIPISGNLQVTIGTDKPIDAPVGQAYYVKGGTPHSFRNLGSTPAMAMEIFVKDGATAQNADQLGAIVAALQATSHQ